MVGKGEPVRCKDLGVRGVCAIDYLNQGLLIW